MSCHVLLLLSLVFNLAHSSHSASSDHASKWPSIARSPSAVVVTLFYILYLSIIHDALLQRHTYRSCHWLRAVWVSVYWKCVVCAPAAAQEAWNLHVSWWKITKWWAHPDGVNDFPDTWSSEHHTTHPLHLLFYSPLSVIDNLKAGTCFKWEQIKKESFFFYIRQGVTD